MVQELISGWVKPGAISYLDEMQSKRLLQTAGIRVADTLELSDPQEVMRATRTLGYPIQVSALVRDQPPGSIPANLSLIVSSDTEAERCCNEITVNARQWDQAIEIRTFTVREAPRNSIELRIEVLQDPVLGRVMAVGYGRMAIEIWEDVAYRVVPLAKRDPHIMLAELKGTRLVGGYRNIDRTNISYIEELLMRVSDFVDRSPEVHTLELDPVHATRHRVLVYDAHIGLRQVPDG